MNAPAPGASGFEAALVRVAAWPPAVWRAAAAAWFLLLCLVGTLHQTLSVDGTRYFWINEDMLVSMRYARSLSDGQGLVFNPGERVEGYSNPLWTLAMAAAHRLPLPPTQVSLAMIVANAGLGLVVLALTDRLRRQLDPAGAWSGPAALLGVAFSMDLAFWAVKGFETTLLTVLFLWALTGVMASRERGSPPLTLLCPLALLPLVRGDALHVWAATAAVALGLLRHRSRTLGLLALSLLPFAAHLVWRHAYYGDWLPNTYYLKVAGQPDRLELGARYLLRFGRDYGVALALALAGAWAARDARRRWLLAAAAVGAAYTVVVGGDMLPYSRFLAHLVPVIVVLAAVAGTSLAARAPAAEAALALCLVASLLLGFQTYLPSLLDPSDGHEADTLRTAVLIERHTRPEARVAVFAAGAVPYFSRRFTIDMLGKTDRALARTPARVPYAIGHGKFDPAWSLAQGPDLVATLAPEEALSGPPSRFPALDALGRDPGFLRDYRPFPVPLGFLRARSAIYVRADSPERERLAAWREP